MLTYPWNTTNSLAYPTILALLTILVVCGFGMTNEEVGSRARSEKSYPVSDEEDAIASRAFDGIASSGALSGSEIRLRVSGSTVSLYGLVADEESKQRAARIVMRVPGVENVRNNLRIDAQEVASRRNLSAGNSVLSQQIAEKLVRELFPHARVDRNWTFDWEVEDDSFRFEVDVDGRDVTLSGTVPKPELIDEVIRAVRLVPGVRSVRSELGAETFDRKDGRFPHWGYHPYPF